MWWKGVGEGLCMCTRAEGAVEWSEGTCSMQNEGHV